MGIKEILQRLRSLLGRKPAKQEIKQALYAINVLFDAPLAICKFGMLYTSLIRASVDAAHVDVNPIREKFDIANNGVILGLSLVAIVIEYMSLYTKKGKIQQVIPRIREGSEKGLFVYSSLMTLSSLVFSRVGAYDSELDNTKEGVTISLMGISFLSSLLFGALMLDKTRMPLTAMGEERIVKSTKLRKILEHSRVFFIASGTTDLFVGNLQLWCGGDGFIPFWCNKNFNPVAIYLADFVAGVIGTSLFALTNNNEKYHRRFVLTALAITTVCWGNRFFPTLAGTIEVCFDYNEASTAGTSTLWSVVLSLTLPLFMAFVRVLQTQERFQNKCQIVPSMELQLAELTHTGPDKDSPRLLPLRDAATDIDEEMKEDFLPLTRNSSDRSEASTATPPASPPLSGIQGNTLKENTLSGAVSEEEIGRTSGCATPDKSTSSQSEAKPGRVSQLGMYAASSTTSGIKMLQSRATWISDTIWGSRKKDAAMPKALRENLLKRIECV